MNLELLKMDEEGRISPDPEKMRKAFLNGEFELIPIKDAPLDTNFMLVAGDNDAWLVHFGLEVLMNEVKGTEIEDNIVTHFYKGAGHIIEPPYGSLIYHSYMRYLPVEDSEGENVASVPILWGGNAHDTCKAQEHLWPRMCSFLKHNIQHKSTFYQNYLNKSKTDN